MKKGKTIRDAVHGYIDIGEEFISILNSAAFQRLKWIEQSSFRVLYPAARHDRFIHSLGTYHLACKVSKCFMDNVRGRITDVNCEMIQNTFHYAALLHDLGHAPFSHTTEKLFQQRDKDGKDVLVGRLVEAVSSLGLDKKTVQRFEENLGECSPDPHEIMSAILLIEQRDSFHIPKGFSIDFELAARMVVGNIYVLQDESNIQEVSDDIGIRNCFIRLLNSPAIDVDKLDYLTRDTKMSGFTNVPIDIERLLNSVTAVKTEEGWMPAFNRKSLSVLDNVFRAKNEQNIWVISHPVVLYESALLLACIFSLGEQYLEKVFSIDSLTEAGVLFDEKRYRLLSDSDIMQELKSKWETSDLVREYFSRGERRKAVWKNYYEYKTLFGDKEREVFAWFNALILYMKTETEFVLNHESLERIENGKQNTAMMSAHFLQEFCEEHRIQFDFVLIQATNKFSFDPNQIYIQFDNLCLNPDYKVYSFFNKPVHTDDNNFFFLYAKDDSFRTHLSSFVDAVKEHVSEDAILGGRH